MNKKIERKDSVEDYKIIKDKLDKIKNIICDSEKKSINKVVEVKEDGKRNKRTRKAEQEDTAIW